MLIILIEQFVLVTIPPPQASNMGDVVTRFKSARSRSRAGNGRQTGRNHHAHHPAAAGEGIHGLCRRLVAQLREHAATPLHLLVFGHTRASAAPWKRSEKYSAGVDWPITWVEGAACDGGLIAGIHVQAFTGGVERITFGGRVVGSVFTDGGARQCLIGGLMPADKTLSRAGQTAWCWKSCKQFWRRPDLSWRTSCGRGFSSKIFCRGMTTSTARGRKFIPA